MNVWITLSRSLASPRCLHNVRFLVGESSSSSIRHFSTNAPASTDKSPESHSHLSGLLKEALTQADSQPHVPHSPPRLESSSNHLTLKIFKRKKRSLKGEKKPKKKDRSIPLADSKTKAVKEVQLQRESCEVTTELMLNEMSYPPSPDLLGTSETWPGEPWATTSNLHTRIIGLELIS